MSGECRSAVRDLTAHLAAEGREARVIRLGVSSAAVRLFCCSRGLDEPVLPAEPVGVDFLRSAVPLAAWADLEPAVLGSILTRSLSRAVRKRTGAEYTPRAYVERVVRATFAPVFERWESAQRYAGALAATYQGGWRATALEIVLDFHAWLCSLRSLDPACGTGNMLYVAMEMLMEVEADVRRWLSWLDAPAASLARRVTPANFTGLEINPDACALAPLVMWMSWHQARERLQLPYPPEVPKMHVIEGDAVLAWDSVSLKGEDSEEAARQPEHCAGSARRRARAGIGPGHVVG